MCIDILIPISSYTIMLEMYEWPLGAKNVQDLTSKVRRLRCHVRRLRCHLTRLRCHLRRLTLDIKSKTFFAPNGHLYFIRECDVNCHCYLPSGFPFVVHYNVFSPLFNIHLSPTIPLCPFSPSSSSAFFH